SFGVLYHAEADHHTRPRVHPGAEPARHPAAREVDGSEPAGSRQYLPSGSERAARTAPEPAPDHHRSPAGNGPPALLGAGPPGRGLPRVLLPYPALLPEAAAAGAEGESAGLLER